MSELPAHLADGWHLLCQARDYIRAGGNKGWGGSICFPLQIFAEQLNLYKSWGGGRLCPSLYNLPTRFSDLPSALQYYM